MTALAAVNFCLVAWTEDTQVSVRCLNQYYPFHKLCEYCQARGPEVRGSDDQARAVRADLYASGGEDWNFRVRLRKPAARPFGLEGNSNCSAE